MTMLINKLIDEGFLRCKTSSSMSECRIHMVYDYLYGYDPYRKDVTFNGLLDNESFLKLLSKIGVLFLIQLKNGNVSVETGDGRSMFWNRMYQFSANSDELISRLKSHNFFDMTYIIICENDIWLYSLMRKKD